MKSKAITIDKVVLSEKGISIPSKWNGNETFIAWNNVQKIQSGRGSLIRILYTSQTGNIKAVSFSSNKKEYKNVLLGYWKKVLVENTALRGYLSGSIYLGKWPLWGRLIFGGIASAYVLYAMGIAVKTYLYASPDMKQIAAWAAYYGLVSFGIVLLCPLAPFFHFMRFSRIRNEWNTWKISRNGLFIQREDEHWEEVRFRPGDRISNHEIVLGGKQVPYRLLTKNLIVPYLLGILASRQGIAPVPGKGFFLKGALRLILFWPFVIAVLWFSPLMFWQVPEFLDFELGKTLSIIFASFFTAGFGFLFFHVIEKVKYRQTFPRFLSQLKMIQQKLGW
jgi:hypothetical protein